MLYDAIRFLLMPLFWQAWGDPEIGWYALASTVHWILFIPAVISAIKLGPRSRGVMLMLVYMAVITAFYSTVRDLAGHRQRYQLIFIFALCQFDFLQAVWFAFKDHSRRLARWANTAPLPYPSSV